MWVLHGKVSHEGQDTEALCCLWKKEKKDVYITTYIQVEITVCAISCNEARFI